MKKRWVDSSMGKRDPREENSWVSLAFGKYHICKPTIICLPGGGCDTSRKANNFCKFMAHLVGLKECEMNLVDIYDYIDVIGFSYGWESRTTGFNFTDEEINEIVNGMLLPLCEDQNGNLIDLQLAINNFAKITFFTYCHGATELSKIIAVLEEKLTKKGYNEQEIKTLFESLMHITYAPENKVEYLPTFSFCSLKDRILFKFKKNYEEKIGCGLNGVDIIFQPKGTTINFEAKTDCVSVFSSQLNNKNNLIVSDEHTFRNLNRNDESWKHIGYRGISSPNADCVSQMMAYALSLAVSSSMNGAKRPTAKEMLEELENIKGLFKPEDLEFSSKELV